MARKRNGLIPAGKTSGGLDRPVKAIHDTSPPAQRGFTQADRRCCMIQLRREWGRFSNFSFRTPQRRISAYPARPSG